MAGHGLSLQGCRLGQRARLQAGDGLGYPPCSGGRRGPRAQARQMFQLRQVHQPGTHVRMESMYVCSVYLESMLLLCDVFFFFFRLVYRLFVSM